MPVYVWDSTVFGRIERVEGVVRYQIGTDISTGPRSEGSMPPNRSGSSRDRGFS